MEHPVFKRQTDTDAILCAPNSIIPEPLGINEFLERQFPPRPFLVSPWLPAQGLVMLHAKRGIGKTFFGLSVALSVASGAQFLGWNTQKARVLYIDGEMSARDMQNRIRKLNSGMKIPALSNDAFRILTPDLMPIDVPNLNFADNSHLLMLTPHLENSDLIFLDNISCLYPGGDENDAESWLPMQEWLLKQKRAGRSVFLIHHSGKNGGQRGTSKREDILDTVLALREKQSTDSTGETILEVLFEKARGFASDDAKSISSRLIDSPGGLAWQVTSNDQCPLDKCVRMLTDGMSQAEIARKCGVNPSTVSRRVRQARHEGLIK